MIILCVASSSIAVILLPGGITTYSWFKIPIKINVSSMYFIYKNSDLGRLIQETSLIVWDKVPMINKFAFKALDHTL